MGLRARTSNSCDLCCLCILLPPKSPQRWQICAVGGQENPKSNEAGKLLMQPELCAPECYSGPKETERKGWISFALKCSNYCPDSASHLLLLLIPPFILENSFYSYYLLFTIKHKFYFLLMLTTDIQILKWNHYDLKEPSFPMYPSMLPGEGL